MSNPAIIAAFVGGIIGGLFSLFVLTVSEVVKYFVRRKEAERRNQRVRLMVKALYRNAFKTLDGYLDQRQRFEATLTFLIERIKREDIAEASEPPKADLVLTSVTALLDGLHGCLAAYDRFARNHVLPSAEER